jgi:hypothetical protein
MGAERSSSVKTVFLSSVARGLEEYREAVYRAVEGLDGYHCVRMEDFGARPEDPVSVCSTRASSCDVFVGIVGQRYGSSPPGDDRSITEIEFEAARAAGVPRLVFLAPEEFPVPANLIERDDRRERQQAFRRRILSDDTVEFFSTREELTEAVVRALHNCRDVLVALHPNAAARTHTCSSRSSCARRDGTPASQFQTLAQCLLALQAKAESASSTIMGRAETVSRPGHRVPVPSAPGRR